MDGALWYTMYSDSTADAHHYSGNAGNRGQHSSVSMDSYRLGGH